MSEDELDELLAKPLKPLTKEQGALRGWLIRNADHVEGLAGVVPGNGVWLARIRDGALHIACERLREDVLGGEWAGAAGRDLPELCEAIRFSDDGKGARIPIAFCMRPPHPG